MVRHASHPGLTLDDRDPNRVPAARQFLGDPQGRMIDPELIGQ